MANQKTFNFYGIRKTSNPDYYSVTLCAGKGEKREWTNVPVKKELVKFSEKEKAYYLKLKPLESKKQEETHIKTPENSDDWIPF